VITLEAPQSSSFRPKYYERCNDLYSVFSLLGYVLISSALSVNPSPGTTGTLLPHTYLELKRLQAERKHERFWVGEEANFRSLIRCFVVWGVRHAY
jgi:hypothetical protein